MTNDVNSSNIASLRDNDLETHEQLRSKTLLQRALWRIQRDPLTLTAIGVLLFLTIASYSAPLIVDLLLDIDYNSPDPYNGKLEIGARVLDSDSTMLQWSPESGLFRRSFIAHVKPITDLNMSSDGELIVTVSEDASMRIWQTSTGRNRGRVAVFDDSETVYTRAAFAQTDSILAAGDNYGYLTIWDSLEIDSTGEVAPIYRSGTPIHEGYITSIDYLADGTIVTGGEDGWLRLWDATSYELLSEVELGTPIIDISASTNDGQFATATNQDTKGELQIWSAAPLEISTTLENDAPITRVLYEHNGERLITVDTAGNLIIRDGETAETLTVLEHPQAVNDVRFIAQDNQLITGSADGVTRIWDTETGEIVQEFGDEAHPYAITNVVMTFDGTQVITTTVGRERFYLLGTDASGRDHLSRLLYAGQISLLIGFVAAIGALSIGVIIGAIAGFFGGYLDDFIIWVVTTMDSIPSLYLLLIVSALLAPNASSLIFILVVLGWTGAARIVRGETFSLRERDFVTAARALGAKNSRIMFIHIVPNVMSVLLIALARSIGGLILAESGLSFLGFGVKPPTPSWGNMLAGDLGLLREAPHLVFAPGLLITITVLCLYIIGDGLRDAFDPNVSD